jgi:hypothetical protein
MATTKKEGWFRGLGPFSKVKEDRKWHTNFVANAEKHAQPPRKPKVKDTNPGARWGALPAWSEFPDKSSKGDGGDE